MRIASSPREIGSASSKLNEGHSVAASAATQRRSSSTSSSLEPAGDSSPFARVLQAVGREMNRGEAMVRGALAGQNLGAAQLLALQAGVYRYSETVDLASRLVDRASSSVKTVIQQQ